MNLVQVTTVEVLGHYRLRLGFSDGVVSDVDLTGHPQAVVIRGESEALEVPAPGFGVGHHRQGLVAGRQAGTGCPGAVPEGGGGEEVVGEPGSVVPAFLESVGDLQVEPGPPGGGQRVVEGGADQGVAEAVGAGASFDHQASGGRFVEGDDELPVLQFADGPQEADLEIGPQHGRRAQHPVGGLRQTGEAPPHHVARPLGDAQLAPLRHPAALPADDGAGLGQVADDLPDEEGVALGLVVDGPGQVVWVYYPDPETWSPDEDCVRKPFREAVGRGGGALR
jgi:hypothetical protein